MAGKTLPHADLLLLLTFSLTFALIIQLSNGFYPFIFLIHLLFVFSIMVVVAVIFKDTFMRVLLTLCNYFNKSEKKAVLCYRVCCMYVRTM